MIVIEQCSKRLLKIISLVSIISSLFFGSHVVAKSDGSSYPSVWVWEVKSEVRTLYLMGELHAFFGSPDLPIDYDLGNAIYEKSDQLWIESRQKNEDNNFPKLTIENRVMPRTWSNVKLAVGSSIDLLSPGSQTQKNQLYRDFVNEMNASNPLSAYIDLRTLLFIKSKKKNPEKYIVKLGLKAYLKSKSSNGKIAKSRDIEGDTSISDVWRKSCTNADTDSLIAAGLSSLESNDTSIFHALQQAFHSPGANLDFLMRTDLTNEASPWITKCSVVPRNLEWMLKIQEILNNDGPPVAALVGIGHLWGSNGLIELLKKNGYKLERIYSTNQ